MSGRARRSGSRRPRLKYYAIAITLIPLAVAIAVLAPALIGTPAEPVMPAPGKADSGVEPSTAYAWGSEALDALREGVERWSPISVANACGSGKSSCFKCHNGRNAIAFSMDPAVGPWHVDHHKVENSCAGCHKGNPRIIKKKIAHIALLGDPRQQSESCGTCHGTDEVAKLLIGYQKIVGR